MTKDVSGQGGIHAEANVQNQRLPLRGWAFCLVDLSAGSPLTHSAQTYVHTRITFRATRREYRNCGGEKKANTSVRRECGTRITLSRLPGMKTRFVLYVQQTFSSRFDSFLHVRIAWAMPLFPMHAYESSFLRYDAITSRIWSMVSAGNSPKD